MERREKERRIQPELISNQQSLGLEGKNPNPDLFNGNSAHNRWNWDKMEQ